jgi:hypothetical protein
LDINNNVTVVDLLYQQFYAGSETFPTLEEQEFMKSLFTSGKQIPNDVARMLFTFCNHLGKL